MLKLSLVILVLVAISFLCSVLESVILSITRAYIQVLVDKKSKAGVLLQRMKKRIDEPIAAILTLNTISHTAGAALSGAIAHHIFGSEWMGLFSAALTLIILVFSEIIPKTIGASYWKQLAPLSAFILRIMIFILKPLIVPVNFLARAVSKGGNSAEITQAEIKNFIRLGYNQGAIGSDEYKFIDNVFQLKTIQIYEIMTPRSVVMSLPNAMTVSNIKKSDIKLNFSRIPVYAVDSGDITGVVLRRDIMNMISQNEIEKSLVDLQMDPVFVWESTPVYTIMRYMIARKRHLCIVLNDDKKYTGIITLEDTIETMLGMEIVDEFDLAIDMRVLADSRNGSVPG